MKDEKDTRFCYGASCTWFGSIHEVGSLGPSKLPCCPFCRGMLFEMENDREWWTGVDKFEKAGHPHYRAMLEWQRAQNLCLPIGDGMNLLTKLFKEATGKEVVL